MGHRRIGWSLARPGLGGPGARFALLVALGLPAGSTPAQCPPVWTTPAGGVFGGPALPLGAEVLGLDTFDPDEAGPGPTVLYVGGGFVRAGAVPARHSARWDGWSVWSAMGSGFNASADSIYAVHGIDANGGPSGAAPGAYYGGHFFDAGAVPAEMVARWSSDAWHAVGPPVDEYILSLGSFDRDGSGPAGTDLFIGGPFEAPGGIPALGLAKWDGIAWSALGTGIAPYLPNQNAYARAYTVFDDDGAGPRPAALYIGGTFFWAGGLDARNIARWDGKNWETLGSSAFLNATAYALCVFDEDALGPGRPALFVGGGFDIPGIPHTQSLARWNGQNWSAVGTGVGGGSVFALCVFDEDAQGPTTPALYVGGFLTQAGGQPVNYLARWDGQQWHDVGGGVTGWGLGTAVRTMAVFDEDGPGPNPGGLYVGGFFTHAGGIPSNAIARWGCPLAPQCYANCTGDTTATGAARLDVNDYICFQTKFATYHPYADCDANQQLNINDYICFQTRFALGCP